MDTQHRKRVLILYYSFSEQTRILVEALCAGLETSPALVITTERLETVLPISLPFNSPVRLIQAMISACFCRRVPIKPLRIDQNTLWDLIIIAGPTWSYLPSGPILALLDGEAKKLCRQRRVMVLISCRAYWRLHNYWIKRLVRDEVAEFWAPLYVDHPSREPWRTIGLFLFLLGRLSLIKKARLGGFYPHYGHAQEQLAQLRRQGAKLAERIAALPDENN